MNILTRRMIDGWIAYRAETPGVYRRRATELDAIRALISFLMEAAR